MRLGIRDSLAALKAFREATNGNVVSTGKVMVRAMICSKCPLKQDIPKEDMLSNASKVLGQLSGKHGVPDTISKKRCGACHCSLLLLIPARRENLHKDSAEEAAMRPDFCWVSNPTEASK